MFFVLPGKHKYIVMKQCLESILTKERFVNPAPVLQRFGVTIVHLCSVMGRDRFAV